MKVPKITVVDITRIRVDVIMTSLYGNDSSIFVTNPKAMAPLMRAAYEMNASYLTDSLPFSDFLQHPNKK